MERVRPEPYAYFEGDCPKCGMPYKIDNDEGHEYTFDWADKVECAECRTEFIIDWRVDASAPNCETCGHKVEDCSCAEWEGEI